MRVGIVGMGVMGGSLLLGLAEKSSEIEVFVVSRGIQGRQWALNQGANQALASVQELPTDLDFIFLSSPSHTLLETAQDIKRPWGNTLISDMASAKGSVVPALDRFLGANYLSSHPMCGSEKTGIEGAVAGLYDNKTVILTPGPSATRSAIEKLSTFWAQFGAQILIKTPEDHDRAVAWVSHMPHLVIPALVHAIHRAEEDKTGLFDTAGTGLRDVSRLAGSNPDLWQDIIFENRHAIRSAIQGMQKELTHCLNLLNLDENQLPHHLHDYLSKARDIRSQKGLGHI